MFQEFLRVIWVICKKDLRVWLNQRVLIAATLIFPCTYLLVVYIGSATVGVNPVAVVVEDQGPIGQKVAQAIVNADVFRVSIVDNTKAQQLYHNLAVVAIIQIPPDFSRNVVNHQQAPVNVFVNNFNNDLTLDVKRAVPDAITQYYASLGQASPIGITVTQHNLRGRDVQLYQYAVLPTIILLITVNGLISSGSATANEFEKRTYKELSLAPISNLAIILGKVLAGFVSTFILGILVLVVCSILGWIQPQGIFWINAVIIIALASFVSSGFGIAVGAFFQRIQVVTIFATILSVYLFSLAGGVGIISFEPDWLQTIARYDPLTYAIHALQMAIFYNSTDQLIQDILILIITASITIALGVLAMKRETA